MSRCVTIGMTRGRRAGSRCVRITGVRLGAILVGCVPRASVESLPGPGAGRQPLALPRTRPNGFDPIGLLLELKPDLSLTDDQVRELRALRAALRRSNGPALAQLDSADAALKGRLGGWLGTARGAELPVRRTRWVPKLAPSLTDRFRVVAMAPRGVAESDAPATGYRLARVAEDARVLLVRLGVDRAVLAAHSIGGVAITHFAARHPDRVRALLYVHAAPVAWTGTSRPAARDPVRRPTLRPEVAASDDGYRRYMATYFYGTWTPALEAELRTYATGPEGERRRRLVQRYVEDPAARPAPLRAVSDAGVPVLVLCALPGAPWLTPGSGEHRRATRFVERVLQPAMRADCEAFEAAVPAARARTLPGSRFPHVLAPDRVAAEVRQWLALQQQAP